MPDRFHLITYGYSYTLERGSFITSRLSPRSSLADAVDHFVSGFPVALAADDDDGAEARQTATEYGPVWDSLGSLPALGCRRAATTVELVPARAQPATESEAA